MRRDGGRQVTERKRTRGLVRKERDWYWGREREREGVREMECAVCPVAYKKPIMVDLYQFVLTQMDPRINGQHQRAISWDLIYDCQITWLWSQVCVGVCLWLCVCVCLCFVCVCVPLYFICVHLLMVYIFQLCVCVCLAWVLVCSWNHVGHCVQIVVLFEWHTLQ